MISIQQRAGEYAKLLFSTGMAHEFAPETIVHRSFIDGYNEGAESARGSLKAEIECRNGWWDRCEKAEAELDELRADATMHWITEEELKQARLARDNAKTCEAIHFGAVRWLERYVKVLKIELHRQELANLRKKRTIRGLRKERSKMRALVKEAREGQAAKINALEALP